MENVKKIKLLVFDSHPVQYRVPVWQIIETLESGNLMVCYATDISVKGHMDAGFGKMFAWDDPLMDGYNFRVLNCENGTPLSGKESLTGKGVKEFILAYKPEAILLTGLNYTFDNIALREANKLKIPVWLRCENQDEAFHRSFIKSVFRRFYYINKYRKIDKFFYIGELNKKHFLTHKVSSNKLFPALYGTVNRFKNMQESEKEALRNTQRSSLGITTNDWVIGFSGKFIPKKHPDILYSMLPLFDKKILNKIVLYFMGSGPMEAELLKLAEEAKHNYGVKSIFTGFVNQSKLANHYLAMDVLALPSRRQGETWGLVVNEAMQAGCSIIVSNAVGCSMNFNKLEQFKVFQEESVEDFAKKILELKLYQRSFNWAEKALEPYDLQETANIILSQLK